jgi:ATP-binding cassette subfamily F protein 3
MNLEARSIADNNIVLSVAVEAQGDSTAPVRAYRQISHERLDYRLAEIRQIATRRSGARGAKARKELIKTEEEFAVSLAR